MKHKFPKLSTYKKVLIASNHVEHVGKIDGYLDAAVMDGAFVVAWDGNLDCDGFYIRVGCLAGFTFADGKTTYRVRTENGDVFPYEHAELITCDAYPEVIVKTEHGAVFGKLLGISGDRATVSPCDSNINKRCTYAIDSVMYADDFKGTLVCDEQEETANG